MFKFRYRKALAMVLAAVLVFSYGGIDASAAVLRAKKASSAVTEAKPQEQASKTKGGEAAGSAFADIAEGSLKIDAKSAVLIDATTGKVLYEQNSHEQLPPASVTKVMTMLLSMEAIESGQISMGDRVTISERAASMGGSQMFMEAGEVQPVENLLKGMAICSANDACHKPIAEGQGCLMKSKSCWK